MCPSPPAVCSTFPAGGRLIERAAGLEPVIEKPAQPVPGWRAIWRDFGLIYATNGLMGFIFAATGPVAIILSVGASGGLSEAQLASWIFSVFFFNGIMTIALSWAYRTPLCFFWTIPGTVLVGPALKHFSFAEVVGAFFVTGILIAAIGLSGLVRRALALTPMPIVMGMVAGVFLRFGLDVVRALHQDFSIAGAMAVAFIVLSVTPALSRRVPPLIGALLVGVIVSFALARFSLTEIGGFSLAQPVWITPAFSLPAMIELVVPLAVTVLVVQNGQGYAVLTQAGHAPPMNVAAIACGVGSLVAAGAGGVSSCLTGATNALIASSGLRERHYTGAMTTGFLALLFGLAAPLFTRFMLAAPVSFVAMLGGLAMLRVLQGAFTTAFRDRFAFGALVSFLVTVADIPLLNIGAAFWGLTAGLALSLLMERQDWASIRARDAA